MPYKFNPFTGKLDNAPGAPVFPDNKFTIFDDGNKTKRFKFEASAISPTTTRTLNIQDVSGPVAIGYGLANQYIRGDATIANFPVAAGGGSSVSYYLNGSVSQGTILGNPYYEINKVPAGAAQTNFTINAGNTTAYFITDAGDPNRLLIPQGNFTFQLYCLTSSGNPQLAVELYKYDGATFTQIGTTSPAATIANTTSDIHLLTVAIPASTTLALTDRLAVRVIGSSLGGHTITLNTEGNTQSQIITTFSTGLAALNGLTDQIQFFATGTTGTDFNIASTAATHTFNIPTASAANRGALSSSDWTAFNGKIGAGLYTATTGLTMNTARLLGRTTAGVGAAEEITVGVGLSLTGGTLTATAGAAVTNVTATAPLTSSGGATPDISTSIATNRIVGRSTAGTGVMEQLTPVGITVSGGNITGIGGTVGTVDNAVPRADGTGGFTVQGSGLIVEDAIVSVTGITGDAGTDVITAPGTAFANGQPIRFTALTGGAGLNTTTNYFVREVSGATFKVETSIGGGAINFTTNITAGTLLTGHSVSTNVTLSENTTATNSDLVLTPKGTGAFILGPKPDGTATGGNARGNNAIDLQVSRTLNTQVALGANSFIGSGTNNTVRSQRGIICGGTGNIVGHPNGNGIDNFIGGGSSNQCIAENGTSVICAGSSNVTGTGGTGSVFIGAGSSNQASLTNSGVVCGSSNNASQANAFIGGGQSNAASGVRSAIVGGHSNAVSGQEGFIGGGGETGQGNSVTATIGSILGGRRGLADRFGQQSHASGGFAAAGDAQRARFVLRNKTTTNAAVELFLDGSATRLTIPSGKVLGLTINITGIKSDGSAVAHYLRQYALKNVAGTCTEVYAPVTIGSDNAAGTSIALSAYDVGATEALRVEVTGIAGETWRWVASVDAVEIAYGL
jgi:hypothetical protein